MSMKCEDYRKRIPEALLHELSLEERQALEAHLADCPSCAEEQRLTLDTLQQLGSENDVAVPRHFFVTREQTVSTPWSFFRQMSLAWKAAFALALLAVGALVVTAISTLDREAGGITLNFGKPSEPKTIALQTALNIEKLKTEILEAVEAKSRDDRLAWMQEMRQEVALSNQKLTQKQRNLLKTALAGLEARVGDRMVARELSMEATWKQSLGDFYETIQAQRKQDLMATRNGIEHLAAQGEVRSNETEAILATLLQVAEYRMK
jgi:Putative zinc-finger